MTPSPTKQNMKQQITELIDRQWINIFIDWLGTQQLAAFEGITNEEVMNDVWHAYQQGKEYVDFLRAGWGRTIRVYLFKRSFENGKLSGLHYKIQFNR